jgi:hypothetical protein
MDEGRQIPIEGRFSASDANPVNPMMERMETVQDGFKWDRGIPFRMKDEGMVVTIRATEIAIRKEEYGTEFTWPIYKGRF